MSHTGQLLRGTPDPRTHAPTMPATLRTLRNLRPPELAQTQLSDTGIPCTIEKELLWCILSKLSCSSAPGLSDWPYDHVCPLVTATPTGGEAVLKLVNVMLSGTIDYIPEVHDAALVLLQKPAGGVRPIVVGRSVTLVGVTHLIAVTICASGLESIPAQLGAGAPRGSSCLGQS
jgi:hypothetical protein